MFKIKKNLIPKYVQILEQLKEYIKKEKLKVGDSFFSELEVSQLFKVSSRTSRQAFQELIKEQILVSHHGKGTFIAHPYIPEEPTKTILILSLYDMKTCFSKILAQEIGGIHIMAEKYGYRLQFCELAPDKAIPEPILKKQVDGVILLSRVEDESPFFNNVINTGIPFISFHNWIKGLPTAFFNDYKIGVLATEHLIKDCGCRRILHLTMKNLSIFAKKRLEGYKDTLEKYDIEFDENLLLNGEFNFDITEKVLETALNEKGLFFDAIFAGSDIMACAALKVLQKKNIKIPQDIKIVGCDNEIPVEMMNPPLTSIHLDRYSIGQETFKILIKIIKKKDDIKGIELDVNLVKRESSKI